MEQGRPEYRNVQRGDEPLGSADDVPDTRQLPAHGTEPNQPDHGDARARLGNRGGLGASVWVVIAVLALLVLLLYGFGVLGG